MTDDNSQWLDLPDKTIEYHRAQYDAVYSSTIAFCDWLEELGQLTPIMASRVLDIGAGMGANVHYMGRRFLQSRFTGVELNPDLVRMGREELERRSSPAALHQGDLFALEPSHTGAYEGVISYHTLMGFPAFEPVLDILTGLGPRWIGISSLFYDGPLTCRTEITDFTHHYRDNTPGRYTYNVFSLPRVAAFLKERGFTEVRWRRFDINIDLAPPAHGGRGTYTRQLDSGERLQFSGPMFLPWCFVVAWR